MLTEKNALVLMWTGEVLPDYLVAKIAEILTTNGICVAELLKARFYDQKGLSNALVRDLSKEGIIPQIVFNKEEYDDSSMIEAVKNAIVYVSKRFENSLVNTNGNYVQFALELDEAVRQAKDKVGFNVNSILHTPDKALINAVEIIATTNAVVPQSFARKYHFTQGVADVIKRIHQKIC